MPAVHPKIVARAILKAAGRPLPDFYGLSFESFKELTILAKHCEAQLRLTASDVRALGPDAGMGLEIRGKERAYNVRVSPRNRVSLEAGPVGGQGVRRIFAKLTARRRAVCLLLVIRWTRVLGHFSRDKRLKMRQTLLGLKSMEWGSFCFSRIFEQGSRTVDEPYASA